MGGRGSNSNSSKKSVIGGGSPVSVENKKSASGGNRWKNTVLEATSSASGELKLGFATPSSYDRPNKNTTVANYKLKAGIYNETGDRSLKSHNINWDNVKSVTGKTYDVKEILKDKGFKYNGSTQSWVK